MEDELKELRDYHRSIQDRYIYYIGGLSTASIGYIVNFQFIGEYSEVMELLKFISITLLGFSIYNGIKFFQNKISLTLKDHELFSMKLGKSLITGTNENYIRIGIKRMFELIDEENKRSVVYCNRQYRYLFYGGTFFIVLKLISSIIPII